MHVVIEADGGSRGNPGPAGYGAAVFDQSGTLLVQRAAGLGETTNNVAEYRGLIAGLTAAAELGATSAEVRMDSKLVIEQMSGRWQVKHPVLQPLASEASELLERIGSVRLRWIPRAQNTAADALANRAMDAARDGVPLRLDGQGDQEGTSTGEPAGRSGHDTAGAGSAPRSWTAPTQRPTRLIMLRHGQTDYSVAKRYSGRSDPELNSRGLRQAKCAARALAVYAEVAAIYSSPLQRCQQTAEAAAEQLGQFVSVVDELSETDFGDWDGLTFSEAAQRDAEYHRRWLADHSTPAPNGESFADVQQRVEGWLGQALPLLPGKTALVVSHVTPVKCLLRYALDAGPSVYYRMHLDLTSICVADFYPDGNASVRLVNDTHHL